jgi:hypothetical protein
MKRTILISMLTAAAMFAQSTPPASAPVTPQSAKTTTTAPASKKKAAKKSAKATTAKPVSSNKVANKKAAKHVKASKTPVAPAASSAPVKQ